MMSLLIIFVLITTITSNTLVGRRFQGSETAKRKLKRFEILFTSDSILICENTRTSYPILPTNPASCQFYSDKQIEQVTQVNNHQYVIVIGPPGGAQKRFWFTSDLHIDHKQMKIPSYFTKVNLIKYISKRVKLQVFTYDSDYGVGVPVLKDIYVKAGLTQNSLFLNILNKERVPFAWWCNDAMAKLNGKEICISNLMYGVGKREYRRYRINFSVIEGIEIPRNKEFDITFKVGGGFFLTIKFSDKETFGEFLGNYLRYSH
jgi:hypothetical protein